MNDYYGKASTLLRLLSNLNDFNEICATSENPYFWERRELLKLEYSMVEKLDDDAAFMENRCNIIGILYSLSPKAISLGMREGL